uniref:Uncharacterized protein n=1 Tax=Arundo donax TaxID=35708 RepID=A0A0A8ZEN2_ARUDO
MRNAREPANTVPNPLFSPLHMVAPAVNSITTTTVMTAHIAFFPIPLKKGSNVYKSETSVRAVPALRA